jgi:hydroxymethylbilane synthase
LRLKGEGFPCHYISPEEMLPAPGQGILALELEDSNDRVRRIISPLDHEPSRHALTAERAFMARLGAGCQAPAAAWARFEDGFLRMDVLVAELDGSRVLRASGKRRMEANEASLLGEELAERLLSGGGKEIMARAERELSKEWEA